MITVEYVNDVMIVKEDDKSIITVGLDRNPDLITLVDVLNKSGAVQIKTNETNETRYKSNIRKYREHKGLTHEQLGKAVGCSRQTIVKLETGSSEPRLKLAIKIADVLGIDIRELLN